MPLPRPKLLMICQHGPLKAASRVRGYQLVEPLRDRGIEVRVMDASQRGGDSGGSLLRRWRRRKYIARLRAELAWADVVYAQRLTKGTRMLETIMRAEVARIYDFDDALYTEPLDAQGRPILKDDSARAVEREWFGHMVALADLVTVTHGELAAWVRGEHPGKPVLEIPGPIDTSRFHPDPAGISKTIGWIGGPSTTPYLAIAAAPLRRALERHPDWRLWLIGAKDATARELNLPGEVVPWEEATEVGLLQQCAFGIQPLPDDPWTRGKGGYKALQYMATGMPVISSPGPFNSRLIRHNETGLLADSDSEWDDAFERLMTDAAARARMGAAAREAMADYALDRGADRLAEAIQELATKYHR